MKCSDMAVWEVYELYTIATVVWIYSTATVFGVWRKHIVLGHVAATKFISDFLEYNLCVLCHT